MAEEGIILKWFFCQSSNKYKKCNQFLDLDFCAKPSKPTASLLLLQGTYHYTVILQGKTLTLFLTKKKKEKREKEIEEKQTQQKEFIIS